MQYKAFISYSHAADGKLAPTLQSALQKFAKPWYRLRAMRVFRDRTSLAATPSLWSSIEQALKNSDFFLLLASPEAAASPWIAREVSWWLNNRSPATMLIVLTGGQMSWDSAKADFDRQTTSAVTPALLGRLRDEPLYVDLCWARSDDHLSVRNTRFRSAVLDLAATLHARPKDELDGDDVREYRRTRRIAWSAGALLVLLTVSAIIAAAIAMTQQRIARSRELAASSRTELAVDPELALILAKKAVEHRRTQQAEDALREALLKSNVRLTQRRHTREVTKALFAGADAVSVSFDKQVLVWDSTNGSIKHQFPGHRVAVCGSRIATAEDSQAAVWSIDDNKRLVSLPGASEVIDDIAFSPDCKWIATASRDKAARIYNSETGELSGPPLKDDDLLTLVAFSPDSRWLVTNRIYNRTDIWEVPAGRLVLSSPGYQAAFSPDSRLVVVGGADNTGVKLWNVVEKRLIETSFAQSGSINSSAFSPDGTLIVTAGSDRTARVWDSRRLRTVAVLSGHTDEVTAAAFSHNGKWIVTASRDNTARIWVARSGELVAELRGHSSMVNTAVFAPDDRRVLTASNDGTARVWATGMADPVAELTESGVPKLSRDPALVRLLESASRTGLVNGFRTVQHVEFSADGRRALIATDTDMAEVWDSRTGQRLAQVAGTVAAFCPSGEWFVTGAEDGTVGVFRAGDGQPVRTLGKHADLVSGLAVSSDGKFIGSASEDHLARIYAVDTGKIVAELAGHSKSLSGIWFDPTGHHAMTASFDTSVILWELPGGTKTRTFQHAQAVAAAAFSADGRFAVTGDDDGVVRIWDVSTGDRVRELRGHTDEISDVHFDAAGARILTASSDGTARIWGTDGQVLSILRGHTQHVYKAVWSPDERFIATAGQDFSIRLWEASTGRLLTVINTHNDAVYDIAFSPDGSYFISGSEDGTAHIYSCEICARTDALLMLAGKRITRALTDFELRTFGLR